MKHIIYTIIFILLLTSVSAQAPGYLGKRFVLGYGAHFSPAFNNPNNNNQTIIGHLGEKGSAETGAMAFNYTHEGFIEYATSAKFMVGFSGKFYKTKYDNGLSVGNSYNYNYSASSDAQGYYDISGKSFCLYGKLYGGRYVAPWGRYIVFGPVLNLYNTTYDSTVMYQNSEVYNPNTGSINFAKISNFGPKEQSFTGFNIMFGWGRTRIIANRITLDYGLNLQLFSVMSLFTDFIIDESSSKRTNLLYIEKTSGKRIRGLNRANAFLKVGFLIF